MAIATRTIKHVRQDLAALDKQKLELLAESRSPLDKARAEKRGLTAEESAAADAAKKRLDVLAMDRDLLEQELETLTAAADVERGSLPASAISVKDGWEKDPKRGYESPKGVLLDILSATKTGKINPRLASLSAEPRAAAGSDEHTTLNDPYGGFLIPKALMPGIKSIMPDSDPLAPLTTKVDMGGARTLKINARVDKDHSSSVSGGLRVYRRAETQTVSSSRTKFEQVELSVYELFGTTYATEELLAASPEAFSSLLGAFFSDEFAATVFEERLNGDGAGRYQGIANSPALVTVSKETGQAADTITFANIVKMIARCWRYGESVWLANPTAYPQLRQMVQPGSTIPIFATGTPGIATLEGRPIYFHERLAALGDLGDIVLVNPREYLEAEVGGMQSADSVHVRFLEHERTFKFWMVNGGAGWWRSALTPKRGDTLSPFVYLQAR